jgi:hypothetical protein
MLSGIIFFQCKHTKYFIQFIQRIVGILVLYGVSNLYHPILIQIFEFSQNLNEKKLIADLFNLSDEYFDQVKIPKTNNYLQHNNFFFSLSLSPDMCQAVF